MMIAIIGRHRSCMSCHARCRVVVISVGIGHEHETSPRPKANRPDGCGVFLHRSRRMANVDVCLTCVASIVSQGP
jgi:hypothetical protein